MQPPAQIVDQPRPLSDQPLAMVNQQPHVELAARELRDRQRLDAFADRGPRDRHRVDGVGLAALAPGGPRAGHQPRRHPHDPFAVGE
jgi:hypothetical protein